MAALFWLQRNNGISHWGDDKLSQYCSVAALWHGTVYWRVVPCAAHAVQQHNTVLYIEDDVPRKTVPESVGAL